MSWPGAIGGTPKRQPNVGATGGASCPAGRAEIYERLGTERRPCRARKIDRRSRRSNVMERYLLRGLKLERLNESSHLIVVDTTLPK